NRRVFHGRGRGYRQGRGRGLVIAVDLDVQVGRHGGRVAVGLRRRGFHVQLEAFQRFGRGGCRRDGQVVHLVLLVAAGGLHLQLYDQFVTLGDVVEGEGRPIFD